MFNAVEDVCMKELPGARQGAFATYGTLGDSLNLMTASWQDLWHVFSIRNPSLLTEYLFGQGEVSLPGPHFPMNILQYVIQWTFSLLNVDTGNVLNLPYRGISGRN